MKEQKNTIRYKFIPCTKSPLKPKMKSTLILLLTSALLLNNKTSNAQTAEQIRNIEIAGLIVDSQSFKPLANAKVFDAKGQQLAVANDSGYFRTTIIYKESGEIKFSFKVESEGYASYTEQEHWGDLKNNINAIYYVGLKQRKSGTRSFSEMETNISDLSFESVSEKFKSVREEILFEQKIETVRKNNDNVFFEIDNSFYIVNNYGWIKLNTKEDKIKIAEGKVIVANQLNSVVKRKRVKGMTPIVSEVASFEISME